MKVFTTVVYIISIAILVVVGSLLVVVWSTYFWQRLKGRV